MHKYKICCLTYGILHDMALQAVEALHDPELEVECISARHNTLQAGLDRALAAGAEVFIAGSSNYTIIKQRLDLPVIGIRVETSDYLGYLVEAQQQAGHIGIVSYHKRLPFDLEPLRALLSADVRDIIYENALELPGMLAQSGCDFVIGGGYACEVATQMGIQSRLAYPGINSITEAIRAAKSLAVQLRKEQSKARYFVAVIEESPNGIVSIDADGIITNYNPSAERYLGVRPLEARGKQVQKLFPELKMEEIFRQEARVEDRIVLYRDQQLHLRRILMSEGLAEATATVLITNLSDFRKTELSYLSRQRAHLSSHGFVAKYTFSDIIGACPALVSTIAYAKIYSNSPYNIMVCGETGTGKELLAQSIHNFSPRGKESFVAVNCAALPDNLLESELFGYKEGAFTGSAKGGKRGLFELADRGTIFLDEIGSISPSLQVKLLRVLQEHEIMQVGGDSIIPVDVRVISASNKTTKQMLSEGFRLDLLYRLNELELELPPLRQRGDDIPALFWDFVRRNADQRLMPDDLDNQDLSILKEYSWPGNIRELHNVSARFSVLAKAGIYSSTRRVLLDCIGEQTFLDDLFQRYGVQPGVKLPEEKARMLAETMHACLGYTREQIAQLLGVSRTTLWRLQNKGQEPD